MLQRISKLKNLTQTQFEALKPGDMVNIGFVEGGDVIQANVADVDLNAGYINVDLSSEIRVLTSRHNCYQNE